LSNGDFAEITEQRTSSKMKGVTALVEYVGRNRRRRNGEHRTPTVQSLFNYNCLGRERRGMYQNRLKIDSEKIANCGGAGRKVNPKIRQEKR